MKILIIEAYSAANIGSGALVENSINILYEEFPEAEIEILAQTPESIQQLTNLPSFHELITLPLGKSRVRQSGWLLKTGIWMFINTLSLLLKNIGVKIPEYLFTYNPYTLTAIRKVKEADMVVSVGAERINDNFYKAIIFSLYMLWMVKQYDKFLVLFPQTIGPFHFKITKFLSAKVLNLCDYIFTRDRRSDKNLNSLGIRKDKIVSTCDVAVLQQTISRNEAKVLLKQKEVPLDAAPLVGISVMRWTYIKADEKSGYEEYKEAIARVADDLITDKNAHIIFLATNVLTEGCREDDVTAAKEIIQLMNHDTRAYVLDRVYTPSQMKGIMGLLDLCIVTRMHACIFSTGIYTPTVSINYQFKLKEYMELVGLGEYTIDIDIVDYDSLKDIIGRAWGHLPEMRFILEKNLTYWSNNLKRTMSMLPKYYEEGLNRSLKEKSK